MPLTIKRKQRTIICRNTHYCRTLWSQGLGLMFRTRNAVKDTAWIFPFHSSRRIAVTMIFVFYPIDILFLDEKKRIIESATIHPFTHYIPKRSARYLIECAQGTIAKKNLRKGTQLQF